MNVSFMQRSRTRAACLAAVTIASTLTASTLTVSAAFAADPVGTSATFSPEPGATLSGELIVWQNEVLANKTTNGFTAFNQTGAAGASPINTGAPVKLMTTFGSLLLWVDNTNTVKTSNPGGTVTSLGAIAPTAEQLLTVGTQLWVARAGGIDRYSPTSASLGGATSISYAGGSSVRMATGPDGNVWVVEKTNAVDTLSRLTPLGAAVGTPLNFPSSAADPTDIALGGDNGMWIIFSGTNTVGHYDAAGTYAEFALPAGAGPRNLVVAPGGVWLNENGLNNVTRLTFAAGKFERSTTLAPSAFGLKGLVVGPDANLWAVGTNVNKVAKFGTVLPTTTVAPTTALPTTLAPTTLAPTTAAPTTGAPTTVAPTTVKSPPTTAKRVCIKTVKKRVKVKGKFVTQRVCTKYR